MDSNVNVYIVTIVTLPLYYKLHRSPRESYPWLRSYSDIDSSEPDLVEDESQGSSTKPK